MCSLVDLVTIEKCIETFSIDEKINYVDGLRDTDTLLLCKTIDSWFEEILQEFENFNIDYYKDIKNFYDNLYTIVKMYNDVYENNHQVINSNIATLEKTRSTIEENIAAGIKQHDHKLLSEKFNSIIEKSSFGYAGTISAMQERLLESVNKETCKYFWFCESNNIKIYFDGFKNYLDELLEEIQQNKTQKIQKLLKERSQYVFNHFQWKNENDYFEYTKHWNNEFIIDEFLGIAGQYISWKRPLAYIEPNTGELTRHIISGDPFYVIDDRELPYNNIVESLPKASQNKIYHYNKKTALNDLEESSIGFCVSWNNFPFKTQGKIFNDMQLISQLLIPGGYAVFNYANADSIEGAKFVEKNRVSVIWKEKIDQYATDNQLKEITTYEYADYPFSVAVYQKIGKPVELNIVSKLGLVLPDEKQLEQKRLEQANENLKAKATRRKLEQDLKRLQERDQLLQDLDEKRQLGQENILELKLHKAINHLNNMIAAYNDYTHPSVLEGLLHVSKITYSLGRIKDSKNLIKRVERDIEKMSIDNLIAKKYREWQNFLNNIDT